MQWIKKNLFFVLGGVVALVLMVLAVWYVLGATKASSDVQEEINAQVAELQRLHDKEPFPSDENVASAKQEQQKVKEFVDELKTYFSPLPVQTAADNQKFQEILGSTIVGLQREAASVGVVLPKDYAFTFSGQKNALQLSSASIAPWLSQLADIQALSDILFKGKVNELYNIQRVPVTDDDRRSVGGSDYLQNASIVTNQTAIFAPYQISFRAFSTDIANVMTGFLQASNCFIVKAITIDPAPFTPTTAQPVAAQVNRYAPVAPPPSAIPSEVDRYGPLGGSRVAPPRPAVAPAPTAKALPTGSVTVLAEHPLRVTMLIESVRLREKK